MPEHSRGWFLVRGFIFSFIILAFFAMPVLISVAATTSSTLNYTPMEKIPGFESESSAAGVSFYTYIGAVYKFGIATVAICAMTMIIIGGYMYVVSAGNNAGMEKAKKYITDAIIGLILALTAWLILYFINPDLIKIKPLTVGGTSGTGTNTGVGGTGGGGTTGNGAGTGKCDPLTAGPCSTDSIKNNSCFASAGADPAKISAICNAESGGIETPSTVDKCSDGTPFSYGAFQVNLTCICKDAFQGPQPSKGCANRSCTGVNQPAFDNCKSQYGSGDGNISAACQLYKEHSGNKYDTWSKNQNQCGFS